MTSWLYLSALVISLLGLGTLDWRHRLALFVDARRTVLTVASAVVLFLMWDLVGVGLGIFFRGDAPYMTGLVIAPEVPIEEVFFLILLNYQTLLLWRAFSRRRATTKNREAVTS